MSKQSSLSPLFIIAPIIAMAVGVYLGAQSTSEVDNTVMKAPPIQGAIFSQAKPLTDLTLRSDEQQAFTLDNLKGHWSVIFAGYTNCPDVCPTTLSVLDQVDKLMIEQNVTPPDIVFISIDPERDKPELIKQYVQYFNKKFVGVTGEAEQLNAITKQLSIVYMKQPGTSGDISASDYLMDHSSSLLLINPDGELQSILTAPHTPMNIIDSIIRSQVYYRDIKDKTA